MTKFIYKNAKNASTHHTSFVMNCAYYIYVFLNNKVHHCLKSHFADKLAKEVRELISIFWHIIFHIQELQKQA